MQAAAEVVNTELVERIENPQEGDRLAALIQAEAGCQHGQAVSPSYLHLGGDNYCTFHWSTARRKGFTQEEYIAASALLVEYKAAIRLRDEVLPGWEEEGRIHFADNSIEAIERATDGSGRTRRVMVSPPSGDVCY
jgi:hypothetical protein